MLCGWEGNRMSGVALAMRHRLSAVSTNNLSSQGKRDENPAYAPLEYYDSFTFTLLTWWFVWRSFGGALYTTATQPRVSSLFWLAGGTASPPVGSCRDVTLRRHRIIISSASAAVWCRWPAVSADTCLLLPTAACRCHFTQELWTERDAVGQVSWSAVNTRS